MKKLILSTTFALSVFGSIGTQASKAVDIERQMFEQRVKEDDIECRMHRWMTLMSWLESRHQHTIDRRGYLGAYQLSRVLLKDIDCRVDRSTLRRSLEQQQIALLQSLLKAKQYGGRSWTTAVGMYKHGILLNESGMFAGQHLAGIGSLKRYIQTGYVTKDGNGTPITKYLKIFACYNITEADVRFMLRKLTKRLPQV